MQLAEGGGGRGGGGLAKPQALAKSPQQPKPSKCP